MAWYESMAMLLKKEVPYVEIKKVLKKVGELNPEERKNLEAMLKRVDISSKVASVNVESEYMRAIVGIMGLYSVLDDKNKEILKNLVFSNLPEYKSFFEKIFKGETVKVKTINGEMKVNFGGILTALRGYCLEGRMAPNLTNFIRYIKLDPNFDERNADKIVEFYNKIKSGEGLEELLIEVKEEREVKKVFDPMEFFLKKITLEGVEVYDFKTKLFFLRDLYELYRDVSIKEYEKSNGYDTDMNWGEVKESFIKIINEYGFLQKLVKYLFKINGNKKKMEEIIKRKQSGEKVRLHWYYKRFSFSKEYEFTGNIEKDIKMLESKDLMVLMDYILHFSYTWGIWRKTRINGEKTKLREIINYVKEKFPTWFSEFQGSLREGLGS